MRKKDPQLEEILESCSVPAGESKGNEFVRCKCANEAGQCTWKGTKYRLVEHVASKSRDAQGCKFASASQRERAEEYLSKKASEKRVKERREEEEQAALKATGSKLSGKNTILNYLKLSKVYYSSFISQHMAEVTHTLTCSCLRV